MADPYRSYLAEVEAAYKVDDATEHSYRDDPLNLLNPPVASRLDLLHYRGPLAQR